MGDGAKERRDEGRRGDFTKRRRAKGRLHEGAKGEGTKRRGDGAMSSPEIGFQRK